MPHTKWQLKKGWSSITVLFLCFRLVLFPTIFVCVILLTYIIQNSKTGSPLESFPNDKWELLFKMEKNICPIKSMMRGPQK